MWLQWVKAWKIVTQEVPAWKYVHGAQVVLNLPEGSEIWKYVFEMLNTDQMTRDAAWKTITGFLESYYKKDDNAEAFETWKEFRNLSRKQNQSIDDYIMIYEKYKLEILRYSMDLEQRVLDFNLLCSANVREDKLRIGMREIDSNDPQNIYKQVKFASKKYCGQSAI